MKTTSKTENRLYDALLKWVEVADSTPSDPDQGVVLSYRADNGEINLYLDITLNDCEDLPNVEVKDGQLYYRNGELIEDLVSVEEAIGYDTIAGLLLEEVKSSPNYNEENAKNFIEYLGK